MKLVHFLKLIRWQNLLMLICIQLLLKFVLFHNYQIITSLTNFDFTLLVVSIVLIAAGGNIINDIFDVKTDTINKPHKVLIGRVFSKSHSKIMYTILTLVGITVGSYLSFKSDNSLLSSWFIIISILLFLYAAYFKKTVLFGNILVSLLIGFSIILLGMFDVIPFLKDGPIPNQNSTFNIILVYAVFAFGLNLIREIIKDIEDVDGDYASGMKTLPIIFGRKRAQNCAFILSLFFTLVLIFTIAFYRHWSDFILGYGLIFVVLPLLYFCYQLYDAESKQELKKLSTLLKIIMISGILSIFII